ncbi:MAG: transcription-repair coupling factor, partial [Desulfobacterales bacterium]|nr:transcription-repair coupling factor [Desulfobacterales bacterium]
VYPRLDSLFDYAPSNALFILTEPGRLEKTAAETRAKALEHFEAARDEKEIRVEPGSFYLEWEEAREILEKRNPVSFKTLSFPDADGEAAREPILLGASMTDNSDLTAALKIKQDRERLLAPLADWINENTARHFSTRLVCGSRPHAERLAAFLEPYDVRPGIREWFEEAPDPDAPGRRPRVDICIGRVSTGFVWPAESLALITEDEIFGPRRRGRKRAHREIRTDLIDFSDLKIGDLVVHTEHGIGRYDGLTKLKLEGVSNDFLLIVYKGEDKLYLPVDRLGMVQKYMGVDGYTPVLDKMGGNSWDKVKARVKKSAEKIAGELLKLYAARKVQKGMAFTEVSDYFRDFEAGFPYEETPDQLAAIEAVMEDMAKSRPMDRLVCGDVGYGKTEVALRASFLAVNTGKQVAVLVPTTVLAEQHHATFSKRFEPYPVEVACLSRFRPAREQRAIVSSLKSGRVDIVIGTHRLLQKDIGFKDLGLLVLDEEQRFGVKHKEKLKRMRTRVDVLALTATPIPRTLHLSLMGIRDICVISTPPEERRSIITYISEFDDVTAAEAIRKEMARKGQIFFIHNSIHNIEGMANRLRKLVPEVRLDVAHGRLGEEELERVMLRFVNQEIDMLVCTTIVESGLDIPAANTILINRADRFGLSQIYQLRGRVGRSDEQAYAYLFIPNDSALGDNARKRLKVLMEYSDLGSGFQIAMSDLKIRGGGAILGASQSGHIAAVGYDMFLKLMEEAVSELKGEPVREKLEPEINLTMSAFIPESYIPDIDQRMSAYKRLVKMTALKEIADFKAELLDRYGALPDEAGNLLLKIMLRAMAIKAGVSRLDLRGNQLVLYFSDAHQKNPSALVDMVLSKGEGYRFTRDDALAAKLSNGGQIALMAQVKNILKEITRRVNG